jgi:hypothetical protein
VCSIATFFNHDTLSGIIMHQPGMLSKFLTETPYFVAGQGTITGLTLQI